MTRSLIALAALASLAFALPATAADTRVLIPFPKSGGIDSWHADSDSALYLKSRNGDL